MIVRRVSLVDVITNSSTIIYTISSQATIDGIKALVNDILKAANFDKQADDLFEFGLVHDPDVIEYWRWDQMADEHPDWDSMGYSQNKEVFNAAKADPPEWWNDYPGDSEEEESILVSVIAKDKEFEATAAALSKLERLFELEESFG